jgi:hypothetical protein
LTIDQAIHHKRKTIAMNKGKNKTRMRPGRKKVKSAGFKKKKVITVRKKVKNSAGFCSTTEDDFVPSHTTDRHTGRMIRKGKRMAQNPQSLKAV